MKFFKKTILIIAVLSSCSVWAGNEDRAGSAGATDLLINLGLEVLLGVLQVFHQLMRLYFKCSWSCLCWIRLKFNLQNELDGKY